MPKGMYIHKKGYERPQFVRDKISASRIGLRPSDDTRRLMSEQRKGKPKAKWSDERKQQFSLIKRGPSNPFWRGGRTELKKAIKNTFEYKQWRRTIFERDNFTCIWCEARGGELAPDHIKPFAGIIVEYKIVTIEQALDCKELWDTKNGRTLCHSCHKKTPTYGVNVYRKA